MSSCVTNHALPLGSLLTAIALPLESFAVRRWRGVYHIQVLRVSRLEDDKMKVCIFGKYPPIQGGVSMRTYWMAHALAKRGHAVHVITNAKEVTAPYRMFMREEDWARCDGHYGAGSVKVHWTESYGLRQWHIPDGMPYLTKLASLGLELQQYHGFDLIFSYYLEPYGVTAHMVAQATGLPHVARTAGSDAGRLWCLRQFGALYNHIFRSADAVLCSPSVTQKMLDIGVEPARIAASPEKHVSLLELFEPCGPALDVEVLQNEIVKGKKDELGSCLFGKFDATLSYFGVYGKLGKAKGTASLLAALKRLKDRGLRAGLLVMAHERPSARNAFQDHVKANGLEDRVCQLPFLPHWRVPEFIRRCVAICCLEQDFPIAFHDPVTAREVLTCGGCLVGSSEVIRKLPDPDKLRDGYNCLVVDDVNQIDGLERKLISVLEQSGRTEQIKRRARQYGVEIETGNSFPQRLESILGDIAGTGRLSLENIRQQPAQSREARVGVDIAEPVGG
jgi:glycosyltransferase involved in cell wall biosynthesis